MKLNKLTYLVLNTTYFWNPKSLTFGVDFTQDGYINLELGPLTIFLNYK